MAIARIVDVPHQRPRDAVQRFPPFAWDHAMVRAAFLDNRLFKSVAFVLSLLTANGRLRDPMAAHIDGICYLMWWW